MTTAFLDDVLPDTIPDVSDIEFPCRICGKESGPYGGRGRRPTKCEEHRGSRKGTPKVTGTNAILAAQAVEALTQINGFVSIGAMITGYHDTASAIAGADNAFREQAYAALLTDPDLCRSILRAGVKSGKVALVIAYAMFAGSVFPTAVIEFRTKKAVKDAERESTGVDNASGSTDE